MSARVHPLAVSSPAFRDLPLAIDWVHPDAPLAHPLDDGTAVVLERSLPSLLGRQGPCGMRRHRAAPGILPQ